MFGIQLVNSITVCTNGRDIVESGNKGMKVFDTGQFDFYYIDTDEIPGFFLLLKNHIFIARSEDIIFIFHV